MTARAHLNGHQEGFAGIALCAFKAAQIETWFVRLDAGQLHRFAASGAVQNADFRNAKKWIGLSGMHDAPFGPGGSATLSVTDWCPWWVGDRTSIRFGFHTYWSILLAFEKSGCVAKCRKGATSIALGQISSSSSSYEKVQTVVAMYIDAGLRDSEVTPQICLMCWTEMKSSPHSTEWTEDMDCGW
jgi:hypothetical protein